MRYTFGGGRGGKEGDGYGKGEGGRGRGTTHFHLLMCSGCMEGGWKEGGGFLCQQVCHSLGEGERSGVEGGGCGMH